MTGDGAHEGLPPARAYFTAAAERLRDEHGDEPEGLVAYREHAMRRCRLEPFATPLELRAWIVQAPPVAEIYDDAARIVAHALLDFSDAHPDVWELASSKAVARRWYRLDRVGFRVMAERACGPSLFQFGVPLSIRLGRERAALDAGAAGGAQPGAARRGRAARRHRRTRGLMLRWLRVHRAEGKALLVLAFTDENLQRLPAEPILFQPAGSIGRMRVEVDGVWLELSDVAVIHRPTLDDLRTWMQEQGVEASVANAPVGSPVVQSGTLRPPPRKTH